MLTVNDENSVIHNSKMYGLIVRENGSAGTLHTYLLNLKTWMKSMISSWKHDQTFVKYLLKLAKSDDLFMISAVFHLQVNKTFDDYVVAWKPAKRWRKSSSFTRQYRGAKRSVKCFNRFVRKGNHCLAKNVTFNIAVFFCFYWYLYFECFMRVFITRHLAETALPQRKFFSSNKNHYTGPTELIRLPD